MEIRVCFVPRLDEEHHAVRSAAPVGGPTAPTAHITSVLASAAASVRALSTRGRGMSLRGSVQGVGNRSSSRARRTGSVDGVERPQVGSDSRSVTSDYRRGVLHISVADSGAGINAEDQAKLLHVVSL